MSEYCINCEASAKRIAELDAEILKLKDEVGDEWARAEQAKERIAELEAHAEHDEDNLEGLQHALVLANQRYTQAEAELDEARREANISADNCSTAEAHANNIQAELAAIKISCRTRHLRTPKPPLH